MLIAFASWEERCHEGLARHLGEEELGPVLLLYYDEYAERTASCRAQIADTCRRAEVTLIARNLPQADPRLAWNTMAEAIGELTACAGDRHATVNITTMPRGIIWSSLWLLEASGVSIAYAYDRPAAYSGEWLSRDPGQPRFMYKMSGISGLGRKTALLILSGYDVERVEYLLRCYEPSVALIGIQASEGADAQNSAHAEALRQRLSSVDEVRFFELNAYREDCGEDTMRTEIRDLDGDLNIVASSLGPKLSAIALYRIQRSDDRIALTYAPSREYNEEYSTGLGDRIAGFLYPPSPGPGTQ